MIKYKGNLKDQAVDYVYWLKIWGSVLQFAGKTNIRMIPGMLKYPWIYEFLKSNYFFRSHTKDRNGAALAAALELYDGCFKYIGDLTADLINHPEETVMHGYIIPTEIFDAMGLKHYLIDFGPFYGSVADQHNAEHYLDTVENYGLPADVCSLPASEGGAALRNEVPNKGLCYISSNLPCDGGASVAALKRRMMKDMPHFTLQIPDFYNEPWADDVAVESLKDMIKFLEDISGKTMDYDKLREICERHNSITETDILAWEYARTDSPVVTGATMWLPRIFHYQFGPGAKRFYDSHLRYKKIIEEGYQKGEKAWKDIRFRAVMWNCPPNVYTQVMEWVERCWGVSICMDLETNTSVDFYDTSTPETMLRGIAHRWCRTTMYKHTHGGAANNLDEMFDIADEYRADFILMANQIACRGMATLTGAFEEEARRKNVKICWFDHDLSDARTISRQEMRDAINNFMFNVMNATPLDESLLVINDENDW